MDEHGETLNDSTTYLVKNTSEDTLTGTVTAKDGGEDRLVVDRLSRATLYADLTPQAKFIWNEAEHRVGFDLKP